VTSDETESTENAAQLPTPNVEVSEAIPRLSAEQQIYKIDSRKELTERLHSLVVDGGFTAR
jgi:hypothetical protein